MELIWIDNDLNFLRAEEFDLETLDVKAIIFAEPSEALNWIHSNNSRVGQLSAILIDAMLPRDGDKRFDTHNNLPIGIVLCKILSVAPYWCEIKNKIVLYTRLPDGDRFQDVKAGADELGLKVHRKSMTSRIALWLRDEKLI